MADEAVITPDAEVNAPQTETTVETTPEVANEQTIGELVEDTVETPRVVDEHIFVAEKKARKAAERELRELRKLVESGATQQEVDESIADISEEFDIAPEFLQRLTDTIESKAVQKLDAKYAEKLTAKEKAEKFDIAFDKAFSQAIERGPEFQSIANVEVIKTLAKLPNNSGKTVLQLLEETYGNALTGKRTIETTTPGGGKDPEPLDYKRATVDLDYYKQVMANPKLKQKFNEMLVNGGR